MPSLSLLRSRCAISIDQLSPEIAERYGPFTDMTSNHITLAGIIASDTHVDIIRRTIARARIEAESPEGAAELAIDLLLVTLAKVVLPHLSGRVHAQISPRHALSVSDTLSHAHRLMRLFAQEGISPGRVCLGIPATGAGMAAAAELEKTGVRTSATEVFSLGQALAARQAGCLYVSPCFNDLSVHFESSDGGSDTGGGWKAYEDPARDHPMSAVIRSISRAYEEPAGSIGGAGASGRSATPEILVTSFVTPNEALAVSTLGVQHVAIGARVIEGLASTLPDADVGAKGKQSPGKGVESGLSNLLDVDWLADDGSALDDDIRSDEDVSNKLEFAIRALVACEARIGMVIQQLLFG